MLKIVRVISMLTEKLILFSVMNGIEVYDTWISEGNIFMYKEKDSSNENDSPVFVIYLDSVLTGTAIDYFVRLKYS
jgi:hypothetical protein